MSLTQIRAGTGVVMGRYRFGGYVATFTRDPESIGPIRFLYVLTVVRAASDSPTLVVTCEQNTMQDQLIAAIADDLDPELRKDLAAHSGPFLCLFDASGVHHNVEQFARLPTAQEFWARAINLAGSRLGVSDFPTPIAGETVNPASASAPRAEASKGFFRRLFGSEPPATQQTIPPCPALELESGDANPEFVRWTVRYGTEFEEIRRTFYTQRPDAFADVATKHIIAELDEHPGSGESLYRQYKWVAGYYEHDLLPKAIRAGGVRRLAPDDKFQTIVTFVRLHLLYRYVCHWRKAIPEAPYNAITRLPI